MNLEDSKVSGLNQIHLNDAINASLMKLIVKRGEDTLAPNGNELIVYVDKVDSTNPSNDRKQYVFELSNVLNYFNEVSDEMVVELKVENNDLKFNSFVKRNISLNDEFYSILETSLVEEIETSPIVLFEGENYIYTNYSNALIEIVYPKNNELNKYYLNNAIYAGHRLNNNGDFSLDDIYFKDAFTKTNDELNMEVDNLSIKCLTSKNNKFSLDEDGNLIVNSLLMNNRILNNNEQQIIDLIYPVGSIYMSVNSINPQTIFGGIWEQLKDRFLLGSGDVYVNETTGGESEHQLSLEEIPQHKHGQKWIGNDGTANPYVRNTSSGNEALSSGVYYSAQNTYYTSSNKKQRVFTTMEGEDLPHNNMPPYLVVNMWKRVN